MILFIIRYGSNFVLRDLDFELIRTIFIYLTKYYTYTCMYVSYYIIMVILFENTRNSMIIIIIYNYYYY